MKSFASAILILFFFSLVTASNREDPQLEVLNLPADETFGPRETRHRSLIQYKAPTYPDNALVPHQKSPTSIIAAASSDNIIESLDRKQDALNNHRPLNSLHNYKSFASLPLISFRTIKISKITSPHKSPIISQLNVLDQLMASAQFPLADEQRDLMAGHLSVLKAHCRNLAATHGPLNPKASNCAFRYHELVRFINLLTKYDTAFDKIPVKRNFAFCSALVSNLRRLQTLVNLAIYEHFDSQSLNSRNFQSLEISANPKVADQLEAHAKELEYLDKTVDSIDLDLLFYCQSNSSNHESINSARDLISKFLHLAFV